MTIVCFSGGVESTTLAFDIGQHPYRYGIVRSADPLVLLSFGTAKKRTQLQSLVMALRKVAVLNVQHVVYDPRLPVDDVVQKPSGSMTSHPMALDYEPDATVMPYTPALILMWAAVAANIASNHKAQPYTQEQVFTGFQYDGPTWAKYDEGTLKDNDTSPEFIDALNGLTNASGLNVWFRAPFLENRMDKGCVVQLGLEVGAPLALTSSCIQGWKVDCGICCQCLVRSGVFKAHGVAG